MEAVDADGPKKRGVGQEDADRHGAGRRQDEKIKWRKLEEVKSMTDRLYVSYGE
jgi:hypothetical protein